MAETIQLVADFTPDVKAVTDLRSYQYFLVQFDAGGVRLANDLTAQSGGYWVLGNKPNSGQACQLVGGPNIYKTVVQSTLARDQFLTCVGSGMAGVCAVTSPALFVARALMPTTVGCGELVMVKLL